MHGPATPDCPPRGPLDETVIQVNGQQFWLYAAVDPDANEFSHMRLFTTTATASTQQFLRELQRRHDTADAVFLVSYAQALSGDTPPSRLPISDDPPWKSERRRTCL